MTLRAFHGDPKLQTLYVERALRGFALDELRQRTYFMQWRDSIGKMHEAYCAVGCALRDPSGGHERYPAELGVPVEMAWLQDRLFERSDFQSAKRWAVDFMQAIPLGADLSAVVNQFAAWALDDPTYGVVTKAAPEERVIIQALACRARTGMWTDPVTTALVRGLLGQPHSQESRYMADILFFSTSERLAQRIVRVLEFTNGGGKSFDAARAALLDLIRAAPVPELAAV